MGKGKGAFLRWVVRLRPLVVFMSFDGFGPRHLTALVQRLGYLLGGRLRLVDQASPRPS
jgi:ribosomal protein L16/L10AE